jgi:Holliday junction DNA helicase RuvA
MIAKLTGKISHRSASWLILDVSGVGYKVFCHVGSLDDAALTTLFTHHYIREDQQTLYGFTTLAELELFELLITVNGVGPKAAMAIMSSSKSDRIVNAIAQGDTAVFKAISGIGPKVAAKIIVELKSKVGGIGGYDLTGFDASNEVVDALETLGYKKPEIAAVLKEMPADLKDTQTKVKWALKAMARQ